MIGGTLDAMLWEAYDSGWTRGQSEVMKVMCRDCEYIPEGLCRPAKDIVFCLKASVVES